MTSILRFQSLLLALASLLGTGPAAFAQPPPAAADLERNPAIQAALDLPREEPDDYLRAILWLIDLGQPELAAPILDELRGLPLSDEQLAALVNQFGSHRLLRVARSEAFAPAGAEFADAAMAAAAAAARDPQFLAQLIDQLADPAAEVRHAARVDLMTAGQAGANAVLEALARETDPAHRRALMSAAARMDPLVVRPLLGMLATSDPALRDDVARLLQHLRVPQAAPLLSNTDTAQRERLLVRALDRYRRGTPPFAPDDEDHVELWHWDDATKTLTSTHHPVDEARTIWMAQLASELAQLRPDNRDYQRQALVLELEAAGLALAAAEDAANPTAGRLPAVDGITADASFLNDALVDALAADFAHSAVALADELGVRGDVRVVDTHDGQPSPLAEALAHPNRRVRFAALRAIMALDPATPYAGSSRVPEALAYFAASAGDRRALVAMPTAARATDLAGALAAQGFESEATNQGTEAVHLARETSDLEVVLVDMDIQSPNVRQVVYELRIHPATGTVPIALMAADGRLADAQRLADEHERVIAVPRPHSPEVRARVVERLLAVAGREYVPPDERAAQAVGAMTWLAQLASRDRTFYALRRHTPTVELALYRLEATEPAIAALERFGTPESQRALANFASQRVLPVEARRAAAAAFHNSIQAHGVLLTTDEVLNQYDRYNASATADALAQEVLAALLDSIESRPSVPAVPPPPTAPLLLHDP